MHGELCPPAIRREQHGEPPADPMATAAAQLGALALGVLVLGALYLHKRR